MTRVGSKVIWKDSTVSNTGIVIDHYRFSSSKYKYKYNHALLIQRIDGKHVLKLEKDIKSV